MGHSEFMIAQRKCSFCYLCVSDSGEIQIRTQDMRRKRSVVTGASRIMRATRDGVPKGLDLHRLARNYGCQAVLRFHAKPFQ